MRADKVRPKPPVLGVHTVFSLRCNPSAKSPSTPTPDAYMPITPFAIIYPNVPLFPTGSVVSLQERPSCSLSEFRQSLATPPHEW